MEIIKKGEIPKYRMTCKTCNTEFEFNLNDIAERYTQIGWLKNYFNTIDCPLCNQRYQFPSLKEIECLKVESKGEQEQ